MSAALRAAYSSGSGAVSHRLLHEPWTLSVAKVTPLNVQRRFSTHGVLPFDPQAEWRRLHLLLDAVRPKENGVLKNTCRSWSSRSATKKPPFDGRSQSVQSLSPGVNTAGARSELKNPSA